MYEVSYQASIIRRQKKERERLLDEVRRLGPSLDEPFIYQNPSLIAPLSALIAFYTEEACQYEVFVNDSFLYKTSKSQEHLCLIWGLEANRLNKVSFVSEDKVTLEHFIHIDSPGKVCQVEVSGVATDTVMFLPMDGEHYPTIYGENGVVKAVFTECFSHHFEQLDNGHFLVGAPQKQLAPFESVDLWEVDMAGFVHDVYHLPSGLSGGFTVIDGDTLVAISEVAHSGTVSDTVLFISLEDGRILRQVRLSEELQVGVSGNHLQTGADWLRASQVIKNKQDKTLLIVTSHIPTIMVYDYQGNFLHGKIKASLAHLAKSREKWQAVSDDAIKKLMPNQSTIALVKETLDKGDMTAYLALQELTEGYQMNHLDYDRQSLFLHQGAFGECKLAPFGNPKCSSRRDSYVNGKWQASYGLSVPSFGSYQVKMYDVTVAFMLDAGRIVGHLAPQPKLDLIFPITSEEPIDEDFNLVLWHDDERLYIRGDFYQGDAVMLELVNAKENRYYYLEASLKPKGMAWYGGQVEGPIRRLHWILPIEDFALAYGINILVDDIRYKTAFVLKR